MITTINLRNLHLSPYKATKEYFFLGMKTFKIYSPSNFQICSTVLLTQSIYSVKYAFVF